MSAERLTANSKVNIWQSLWRMRKMNVGSMLPRGAVVLPWIMLMLMELPSLAHKMMVEVIVSREGRIEVRVFFPDGTPARKVKVEVFSPGGESCFCGATDDEGMYVCGPAREGGVWRVVAEGRTGHRVQRDFEVRLGKSSGDRSGQKEVKAAEAQAPSSPVWPSVPPERAGTNISSSRGHAAAPKEAFLWREVISGVGFIFGLFAFVLALQNHRRLRRLEREGLRK
jgi:hypothetical protein